MIEACPEVPATHPRIATFQTMDYPRYVNLIQRYESNRKNHPEEIAPKMAEGVGFEPTEAFQPLRFSRPAQSTTLPPLLFLNSRSLFRRARVGRAVFTLAGRAMASVLIRKIRRFCLDGKSSAAPELGAASRWKIPQIKSGSFFFDRSLSGSHRFPCLLRPIAATSRCSSCSAFCSTRAGITP